MVNLNSIPTSNTLAVRVALARAGNIVASLDPGYANTLTVSFDQVILINPGNPPQVRNQNPAVAVTVSPGNVAFLQTVPNGVALKYSPQ
jgi:hypothetical protein